MLTTPIMTVTWLDLIIAAAIIVVLVAGTFHLGGAWEWARRGHARKHALLYARQILLLVHAAVENGHELDGRHRRGIDKALARIDQTVGAGGDR